MTTDAEAKILAELQAELDKLIRLANEIEALPDFGVGTAFALLQTERAIVPVPTEILATLLACYCAKFPDQTRRVFATLMQRKGQ